MSDLLVARQGPLAHVWLASNYDKKLSKQQFLNTNIVASSRIISSKHLQSGPSDNSVDTITLRLSGQLLLGIVRIYSRKTKYLLDDIHEVLYKLRNSFKSASGATIGHATANAVNLPPQKTTLSNLDRITLLDQVTNFDLFYQDDLVLDEEPSRPTADAIFSQMSVGNRANDDQFDLSMEVGRGAEDDIDLDLDLDLDFDLNSDHSIEIGRDAQAAMPEAEQSLLDIEPKSAENAFDMEPLQTTENAPAPIEPERQPRRLVGLSESGVVKTTKRKLMVDSEEDLERGIPNEVLRNIQVLQTTGHFAQESLTLKLTQQEKLDLINELASENHKRRRIWNLDSQLRQRCLELSQEEEPEVTPEPTRDFDTSIDFDLSLPDIDVQTPPAQPLEEPEEQIIAENPKATSQIAAHLRDAFYEKPSVELRDLIVADLRSTAPLGMIEQQETLFKYSEKKEATKCFFELLVLASHDCVTLEQEHKDDQVALDLQVRPRDNLVTQFI